MRDTGGEALDPPPIGANIQARILVNREIAIRTRATIRCPPPDVIADIGNRISRHCAPMFAKLITRPATRNAVVVKDLSGMRMAGTKKNIRLVMKALCSERFQASSMTVNGLQASIAE